MTDQIIAVNGKPFLGRLKEQQKFRTVLREFLTSSSDGGFPYIFLLYGDGGIGKTTLAKRFRDIAELEQPFESEFQILWIDWEEERKKVAGLQIGRENISIETVFDVIHSRAIDQGWGHFFDVYQKFLKQRDEVEKEVGTILESVVESDQFTNMRKIGAGTIAKYFRANNPEIGDVGETLTKDFLDTTIKISTEQLARKQALLSKRLRTQLDPSFYRIYTSPKEQMAWAISESLRKVASKKHLLIFLDTYEIIDQVDIWIREVIQNAGSNTIWVISGRNDLVHSRMFGDEFIQGYMDDFPGCYSAFDIEKLALEEVKSYFNYQAPERSLTQNEAIVITRATRGIPLAIRQAVDIWASDAPINEIVGDITDAMPRQEIVRMMTTRYLLHAVAQSDKKALYALTLAHGDIEILNAMLRPSSIHEFDLEALLRRLSRDYASVHVSEARLHDEPSLFIEEYLRGEINRKSDIVQDLIKKAVKVLYARLEKLERELYLLEDRCLNNDWINNALDLTTFLFWLDEDRAWKWFVPCFVDGLGLNQNLQRGLIEIAKKWKEQLSQRGRNRFEIFSAAIAGSSPENTEKMLAELEKLAEIGYLERSNDEYNARNRYSILKIQKATLNDIQREYFGAKELLLDVCNEISPKEMKLRKKYFDSVINYIEHASNLETLTSDLYLEIGNLLQCIVKEFPAEKEGWRLFGNFRIDKYSQIAEEAYNNALKLDPNYAPAHLGMAMLFLATNRLEDSHKQLLTSIELDPYYPQAYIGLGVWYCEKEDFQEAIEVFNKALEIGGLENSPISFIHYAIGEAYRHLGNLEMAKKENREAISVFPRWSYPYIALINCLRKQGKNDEIDERMSELKSVINEKTDVFQRACAELIFGNTEKALLLLKETIEQDVETAKEMPKNLDLELIWNDPTFIALLKEYEN